MMQQLQSDHEVVTMDEKWLKAISKQRGLYKHGIALVMPEGWVYPGTAPIHLNKQHAFEFRPEDVLVMTFPKSGTTWMQEIVWTMLHNPNLDNPKASENLFVRSIDICADMALDGYIWDDVKVDSFEKMFNTLCPGKNVEDGLGIQCLQATPGRRVIKSHYPFQLMRDDLLEKTKVIYVARNTKDVIVSYYHFSQVFRPIKYEGSFEEYVEDFMNNKLIFMPYWPHLKKAWDLRHHPNLHFVFYEDLKADIMGNLKTLNEFIQANLSDKQLENVAKHTTFSSMKSRGEPLSDSVFHYELLEKSGGYIRKGTTGDWKNHFTPELLQKVDSWIEENAVKTGVCFK